MPSRHAGRYPELRRWLTCTVAFQQKQAARAPGSQAASAIASDGSKAYNVVIDVEDPTKFDDRR